MRTTLTLTVVALAAGCASNSAPIGIGRDTFMLSKQAATGFRGLGTLKAEAIAEGNEHCHSMGRELLIVTTQESQPPYVLGNFPRAEITYACLDKDDPALTRPRLEKQADTVIQIRK